MPASYLIDVASGIVYTRGWGVLTDAEIAAHAETLRADPRFDPGFRQIVDFRELNDIRVSGAGVREVARHNPFRRDARRAFVVTTDEAFGLTRMFGMFTDSSGDEFRIFRAVEPAFEWIGLDPKTRWPAQPPDATFGGP
jgi:hypothetical protein